MQSILTNWKTSLGGILMIAMAGLHQFAGVSIPGFNMDFTAALTAGLALLLAQDGVKSGS